MNIRIKYIIAAATAIIALASCSKEQAPLPDGGGTVPEGGVRVISVSFDAPTKSTMGSGFQPEFNDGDWIKLSNTTAWEDCQVRVSGGKATIKTTLTGDLTAVYPREAALTDANGLITGDGFKVSSTQSGKFSDANICMATIGASASSAIFRNKTAILRFYVDESIGVKSVQVSPFSTNIHSDGGYYTSIKVDPDGEALVNTVTDGPDCRICYVAVLPNTHKLTFRIETTTQGNVQKETADIQFEANGIYNVFIPYYIKVKVSDTPVVYQYWGYCNVGAFLPEERGYFFSWGNVKAYIHKDSDWYLASDGTTLLSGGFSDSNYSNGVQGNGNNLSSDIVDFGENDAAYKFWGQNWCLPSNSDFQSLLSGTGTTTADYSSGKGLTVKGTSLLFPLTGFSNSRDISNPSYGYYTTTSRNNYYYYYAFRFYDSGCEAGVQCARFNGYSVRPIYLPPVSSKFETYNDGDIIL